MKILLCTKCTTIFNLKVEKYLKCDCGDAGGIYVDSIHAKVHGNKQSAFVLGFANSTVVQALRDQINHGDLPPTMFYAGKMTSPGRTFDAFVIPDSADSVEWLPSTDPVFQ